MAKNIDLVLFDVGGTLAGADNMFEIMAARISDSRINAQILEKAFVDLKNGLSDSEFKDVQTLLRITAKDISQSFDVKIDPDEFPEIYRHVYTETVYLYDGVIEILEFLKSKNIEMIVVSDADAEIIRPQLKTLNIDHFFKGFVISSEINAYKPSNKICQLLLEILLEKFQVDTKKTIFVGDHKVDIQTAEKINAKSIFIGNHNLKATHTVRTIKNALQIFEEYYK